VHELQDCHYAPVETCPQGQPLCNACGLFFVSVLQMLAVIGNHTDLVFSPRQKLHGITRPLSLKTDVIKKRNRNGSSLARRRYRLSLLQAPLAVSRA